MLSIKPAEHLDEDAREASVTSLRGRLVSHRVRFRHLAHSSCIFTYLGMQVQGCKGECLSSSSFKSFPGTNRLRN